MKSLHYALKSSSGTNKKSRDNLHKHKVSFKVAAAVFFDPFRKNGIDDREDYDEVREWAIGIAEGRLLYVVFTERENRIRIISARKATTDEEREYASTWYRIR